eukprot:gene7527-5307_t
MLRDPILGELLDRPWATPNVPPLHGPSNIKILVAKLLADPTVPLLRYAGNQNFAAAGNASPPSAPYMGGRGGGSSGDWFRLFGFLSSQPGGPASSLDTKKQKVFTDDQTVKQKEESHLNRKEAFPEMQHPIHSYGTIRLLLLLFVCITEVKEGGESFVGPPSLQPCPGRSVRCISPHTVSVHKEAIQQQRIPTQDPR